MMDVYYDRDVDIARFGIRDPEGPVKTVQYPWGLEDRDITGRVTAIEIWRASHQLPPFLAAYLPRPVSA